jgi:hypothetical protein
MLSMIASYNQSNRVFALLLTKQKTPTLKFAIPCLQYSIRIQCALFNSCMLKREKYFRFQLLFSIATVTTNQLPPFLKQISTTSDTILLFKEDNNPIVVIKDVRKCHC